MANPRSRTILADQLETLYRLGTVGGLPDDQLVERFQARNDLAASEAAFRALVDRHGAVVLSVCERILGNSHDAHDAFQAKLFQVKGDEPDPIRITLEPTGTVTGRLVDDEARPRPLVPMIVLQHSKTRASGGDDV